MEADEQQFEIGGFARHTGLNKGTDLLNVNENEVLTRYANGGVFYTQVFFKHELAVHTKNPAIPISKLRF